MGASDCVTVTEKSFLFGGLARPRMMFGGKVASRVISSAKGGVAPWGDSLTLSSSGWTVADWILAAWRPVGTQGLDLPAHGPPVAAPPVELRAVLALPEDILAVVDPGRHPGLDLGGRSFLQEAVA